jgi:uncharacterized protein YjbI with pentapeptide repeats
MTKEQLAAMLAKHAAWLNDKESGARVCLTYADLRLADLQRAMLQEANLPDARLYGANFKDADLYKANLQGADMQCVNARNAYFRSADLQRADLQQADMRNTDLRYTNLLDADLQGADLRYANLRYCIGDGTVIKNITWLEWHITYTKDVMAIGCKQYAIAEWRGFADEQIAAMGYGALDFWQKHREYILTEVCQ